MKSLVFLVCVATAAQQKQIAITIDDLPCVGCGADLAAAQSLTKTLLSNLKDTPAIGFVNEIQLQVPGERKARIALLEQWIAAGKPLGNHTYSHIDPNKVPVAEFTDNIVRGEAVTKSLMAKRSKGNLYFRHPFTHTGPTKEYKDAVDRFLTARGYKIAPFTMENEDYMWSLIYRRTDDPAIREKVRRGYLEYTGALLTHLAHISTQLFGREIPQILVIHANSLNADVMPDLLRLFRDRGYRTVDLDTAMSDPAYSTPDTWVGDTGPSWLYRWAQTSGKKVDAASEPESPQWMRALYLQHQRQ